MTLETKCFFVIHDFQGFGERGEFKKGGLSGSVVLEDVICLFCGVYFRG